MTKKDMKIIDFLITKDGKKIDKRIGLEMNKKYKAQKLKLN